MTAADWQALRLTASLAFTSTAVLLLLGTPLAWWLARSRSRLQPPLAALVALPLVLPPSVLGFYLLLLLGPQGAVGALTETLGLGRLPFTFAGLVVATSVATLPFVVQPLQQAFEAVPESMLEAASTLRAGAVDRFFSVALPLARPGLATAAVLGFAHVVGEFGVVLMVGGNIPGATRVLSVAVFEHVEAGETADAHRLAAVLVVFALAVVGTLQAVQRRQDRRRRDAAGLR